MSTTEIQYLENVVASQEYLARAARSELDRVQCIQQPSPSDLLRARAFIHAHAGMNDQAVAELNSLVSESNGTTPELLNKLAQVRLRRQSGDDVDAAAAAAVRALDLPDLTAGDRWLAHQNLALARWSAGDLDEARNHAKLALEQIDDPRTRVLIAHLSAGGAGAKAYALLNMPEPDMQVPGQSKLDVSALVPWVSRMEPMA